jgi:hypothetical protein
MKQVRVGRRNLHSPGFLGALLVMLGIAGLGLSVPLLHHRANLPAGYGMVVVQVASTRMFPNSGRTAGVRRI